MQSYEYYKFQENRDVVYRKVGRSERCNDFSNTLQEIIKAAPPKIFSEANVHKWLEDAGFVIESEYGSYYRKPVTEHTARCIIYARRTV